MTAGDDSTVRVYCEYAKLLATNVLQQQIAARRRERKQFMLEILTV